LAELTVASSRGSARVRISRAGFIREKTSEKTARTASKKREAKNELGGNRLSCADERAAREQLRL
jgi:hypothetical protein